MAQTLISFPLGLTRVFLKVAGVDNFAAYLLRWELMTSYRIQQELESSFKNDVINLRNYDVKKWKNCQKSVRPISPTVLGDVEPE